MERPMTRICGAMFLLLFRLPSLAMAVEWNAIIEAWELTQGIQWFLRGGPIMYQILACSIIARAVFFDRLFFLRRKHLVPERLRGVKRAWQRGEFEVAWGPLRVPPTHHFRIVGGIRVQPSRDAREAILVISNA
jgi:hypothetical protein